MDVLRYIVILILLVTVNLADDTNETNTEPANNSDLDALAKMSAIADGLEGSSNVTKTTSTTTTASTTKQTTTTHKSTTTTTTAKPSFFSQFLNFTRIASEAMNIISKIMSWFHKKVDEVKQNGTIQIDPKNMLKH